MSRILSRRERRALLERPISDHVIQGFRVVERTNFTVKMYKPRIFSLKGCLLGLGIFYAIYYLIREHEETVMLEVTPYGEVRIDRQPVGQRK